VYGPRSRAAAGALLLTLLAASPAAAHVTVVPPFAQAGTETRLVLDVPNERLTQPMTSLEVTVPAGMTVRSAEPLGVWRGKVDGREARWTGGSLAPRTTAQFAVVVVGPPRAGAVQLRAVQGYPDQGTVPWQVDLTITPGNGGGTGQHLGAAALAAVVGLFVIGGSLLILHRLRRRRTLQEG
jgi:hypothetical protein